MMILLQTEMNGGKPLIIILVMETFYLMEHLKEEEEMYSKYIYLTLTLYQVKVNYIFMLLCFKSKTGVIFNIIYIFYSSYFSAQVWYIFH